jgi:SAM-dependent methyltransferase
MHKTVARIGAGALCAGFILNAARLNRRLSGIRSLEPSTEPVQPHFRFILAEGIQLDDDTRRAASAFARRDGFQVLDLIPADLPAEQLLDLARRVNTPTFSTDRLAPGYTSGHAILAEAKVLARLGINLPVGDDLTGMRLADLALRLKKCAPATAGFAVAPTLRAAAQVPQARVEALRKGAPIPLPATLGAHLATGILTAISLATVPVWGSAALLAYLLQPRLVRAGHRFNPADRHRGNLPRPAAGPYLWLRTALAVYRLRSPADQHTDLRAEYEAEITQGVERFLEPRRDTCPWCGSADLKIRVVSADVFLWKPGRFTLEECRGCGHIFQNPRLTIAGLDFYYRDCYDGIGEAETERVFAMRVHPYVDRAEILRTHATPRNWLDVGTGHAHFCLVAKGLWPATVFDGLDMSNSVETAERHGWIEEAHRGIFTELTEKLEGSYDVVSMYHYLEHTLDPKAELDAAHTALAPGGHLIIEVPDPESRMGRLLGRRWFPWGQPQHLNLVSIGNLKEALAERDFTLVAEERVTHRPSWDFAAAVITTARSWTADPRKPWSGVQPSRGRSLIRAVAWIAAAPVAAGAGVLDLAVAPFLEQLRCGSAYRLLACKNGRTRGGPAARADPRTRDRSAAPQPSGDAGAGDG